MFYIKVIPRPGTGTYELCESVTIEGHLIPKYFKWDGASIPSALWWMLGSPFSPALMVPSMVHDFLYDRPGKMSRKEIDKLFRKLLIHNGVDEDLAETMYTGVRLGGGSHFNKRRLNGNT
jgi:hypothetical protein